MTIRQPTRLTMPVAPEEDIKVPVPPEVEKPPEKPEPEPKPEELEKEAELEKPEEEPPPVEDTEQYTDEEWEALTPEERAKVWEDYEAAQIEEARLRQEDLDKREKKLKEDFVKLEKSKAESQREFQERMKTVKEFAAEKDVDVEYKKFKEAKRATRKDPVKLFENIEIEPLFPEPKTPQERQANANFVATGKRIARAVGKAIAPQLEVLNQLQTGMEKMAAELESQGNWATSMAAIAEEQGLEFDDPTLEQVGKRLKEEEMVALGSAMSPTARKATLHRILSDLGTTETVQKTESKLVQFPKKPPPGVKVTRKPPRRPPATMGSRGGTTNRPEPSRRSVVADIASGIDVK